VAITSIKTGSSFTNLVKYNDFLAGNPAFSPGSYESIATVTASGGETSLSLTSISGTYVSLQMRYIGMDNSGGTSAGALKIRFNSDSGTNYTEHRITGSGSAASASGVTGRNECRMDYGVTQSGSTSIFAVGIMDLNNYASTTQYKTMRGFGGQDKNGTGFVNLASGLWLNTAAITSITVLPESSAFAAGSTFALYGIKG
jgi:hypothetical protein